MEQGSSLLLDVMTHPVIISASDSFKNLEEQRVTESCSTKDRYVYIFQREYAVVNPALVDVCMLYDIRKLCFFFQIHSNDSVLLMRSLLAWMKQQLV